MVITKQCFTRERSIPLLASKNEFCATKANGFQCKLLSQRNSSYMLQALGINSTWQIETFVFHYQPSYLMQ